MNGNEKNPITSEIVQEKPAEIPTETPKEVPIKEVKPEIVEPSKPGNVYFNQSGTK